MVTTRIKESDDLSRGALTVGGGLHRKVANSKVKCILSIIFFVGWVHDTTTVSIPIHLFFYVNLLLVTEDSCIGLVLYKKGKKKLHFEGKDHRLNMEIDFQSLFGLHVT